MRYSGEIKGHLNGVTRAQNVVCFPDGTHRHTLLNPLSIMALDFKADVFPALSDNGESCSVFVEQI